MMLPINRLILGILLASFTTTSWACDSIPTQTENLRTISVQLANSSFSSRDWPASMHDGNASWYKGGESYVRKNKYCAATPIKRGIKKGICLMVTSKKDPSRHVAVLTSDVGLFDSVPHRVLDLCKAAAEKVDPDYRSTGKMEITAVEVDKSLCEEQSKS